MKILNTTKNIVIDLIIRDRKTGVEWTNDLIGNSGERLTYNHDLECHEMNQDQIDWWKMIFEGLESIEDLKEQAKELLGEDDYEELIYRLSDNADDLESYIIEYIHSLKEAIAQAQKVWYKIGFFKNGQQIAKEVFSSDDLEDVKVEFERIFKKTVEDEWEGTLESGQPEGTLYGTTFEEAWKRKHFGEGTNNVAVFKVQGNEALHTHWTYQGCTSKMM